MSLKVKLKRAFSKARKFLIFSFIFVIIVCSFSISVSAENKYKTSFINLTKARATNYVDSEFSSTYTLYPVNMHSPFGGNAQGFKLSSLSGEPLYRGINANMYYDSIQFLKNHEYNISFYIFIYEGVLNPYGLSSGLNDLVTLNVGLCDSTREIRLRFVPQIIREHSSAGERYTFQFNDEWNYSTLTDSYGSDTFGFYKCSASFVPSETFTSTFFNFYFDGYNEHSARGYFGLSDLVLSYTIDPLTDPNYNSVDGGSIDEHNDLSAELDSATASGRDTAVQLMDVSNDGYTDIFKGLMVWSEFIDLSLSEIDWFDSIVDFSLTVGLYAFLLGLAIYAVGRLGRKSSSGGKKGGKKGGGG